MFQAERTVVEGLMWKVLGAICVWGHDRPRWLDRQNKDSVVQSEVGG